MRCGRASLEALLAHPKYSRNQELLGQAGDLADALIKKSSYAMISHLPSSLSRKIMVPHIPGIVKKQRTNGLWRIKDAERISFEILLALSHAGLLKDIVVTEKFRYDPFQYFLNKSDFSGYCVRNNFLCTPLPTDEALKQELTAGIISAQSMDGSWGNTIVYTCKMIERLILLGEKQGENVNKAAAWLLSTYNQDVEGHGAKKAYGVPAHHMFLTSDRGAEYRSALKERPEWDPKQLCYNHLAMVQNGTAIYALIQLGFGDDRRVIAACDNLFFLKQKYGGWCQTNIRGAFITETKKPL